MEHEQTRGRPESPVIVIMRSESKSMQTWIWRMARSNGVWKCMDLGLEIDTPWSGLEAMRTGLLFSGFIDVSTGDGTAFNMI